MRHIIRDMCLLVLVLFIIPTGLMVIFAISSSREAARVARVEQAAYEQVVAQQPAAPDGCDFKDQTGRIDPRLRDGLCSIADAVLVRRNDVGIMVSVGTALTMQARARETEDALLNMYERLESRLGAGAFHVTVYHNGGGRDARLLTIHRSVWSGAQLKWIGSVKAG